MIVFTLLFSILYQKNLYFLYMISRFIQVLDYNLLSHSAVILLLFISGYVGQARC